LTSDLSVILSMMWMKRKQEAEKAMEHRYEEKIKTCRTRVKDLKEERARLQGRVSTLDQQLRECHEESTIKSGEQRKRGPKTCAKPDPAQVEGRTCGKCAVQYGKKRTVKEEEVSLP
jgi:predicted nuclease with TOPRIM domain